jgi:integrase/recombinase XerD
MMGSSENPWFSLFPMKRILSLERVRSRRNAADELRIICARFGEHLAGQGYSLRSVQHYVAVAGHFGRWLECSRYSIEAVGERLIARFCEAHLPRCQCPPPATACLAVVRPGLHHLLAFLRHCQICSPPPEPRLSQADQQVIVYDRYLEKVCGLSEATRRYRRQYVREFLQRQFGHGSLKYGHLKAKGLVEYVHWRATPLRPSTARLLAGSLRSFLRFLQVGGKVAPGFDNAILAPATRGLGALPKTLTEEQRKDLLRWGFNRQSAAGRRDFAMVVCQLDLGLRACEVAGLSLDDLDWAGAVLRIRQTKSRRERCLPLTDRVGRALSEYLQDGRPRSTAREVFLRHAFPLGRPLKAETVRGAMREAYLRAGLGLSYAGTHILRRTFATRLHQRSVGLKSIADLLGHQSPDTTTAYTRINLKELRQVALPWPK